MKSNNDWQIKNLKDICTSIIRGPFGSSLKKKFFITKNSMSYKVYEQKNAIHSNAFIGTYYISKDKFQKLKRFEVKANDIIMSCSGTIGKLYTIPENAESGIINQALLKFTLNNKLITNSFFLYYLKTIVDNIEKKGSGIQNIGSVNLIKKLKIPIPPIYIQEQIVKELDALSDIITKKKEQFAELDKLAKATFYNMFGDPVENEKEWNNKLWSEVLTIYNGKNQKKVENKNGEYPICGSGGIMGYADAYICPENTVIIGRKGNINKPIFMRKKFWNVDTAFGLVANYNELNPNFLFYFCLNYNFEKHNKAVTIPSLTKTDLLKIAMPCPPLSLQNQFAKKIEAIEQQKAFINQSITDTQLLFDYTMDKYFN